MLIEFIIPLTVEDVNTSANIYKNNEEIAAISIDDKATKKIGKFSDNGMTWIDTKALDDEIWECRWKGDSLNSKYYFKNKRKDIIYPAFNNY